MAETCVAGGQQSKVLGNREKMGDTSLIDLSMRNPTANKFLNEKLTCTVFHTDTPP